MAKQHRRISPTNAPEHGIDEARLSVTEPKRKAAGIPGVAHSLSHSLQRMGVARSAKLLAKLNQTDGFDCMGCAWPDPDPEHRKLAEFCENGAKAVAEEATKRRVGPEFFAAHPVSELATRDDYWLGQQGRIVHPMVLEDGAEHYRPIEWEAALDLIADELCALEDPDEAIFYTSGRTSNEAAFLYQLMVRGLGTNNLPDCSNMCHESSGWALANSIGIGKGSVTLTDVENASLIIIAGQNPGTNHPRMLGSLETAKGNGAVIVAVNPLPEAGLINFKNPQTPRGLVGPGTKLADDFLQIRLGGDLALFSGLGKALLEAEEAGKRTAGLTRVFDHDFIDTHTSGFGAWRDRLRTLDWAELETATGLDRSDIEGLGRRLLESDRTVVCWAMGLTQHKNSVASIQEIVNVLLAQGNLGKPGAGVCPVRGHSNVQGDRTMGIFERMPEEFHDALDAEFEFSSPREHGYDTVAAIRAMRDAKARVFMAMGGNFVRATPDTAVTEQALSRCSLTVQVSTKLNRSHVITGSRALILPALGRTDIDIQADGVQRVSVEDSMSMVHASQGKVSPPSDQVRSEVWIVAQLGQRLADRFAAQGRSVPKIDWLGATADYREVRRRISAVVPGFADFEARLDEPGGFVLPHPPRDERRFATPSGRAEFTVNELSYPKTAPGQLLLQTLRSHDQFNTTIYGQDDRYRGILGGRRVVFVNPADLAELGIADGEFVDLLAVWDDDLERRAPRFRVVSYDTAKDCAAAYYPETNVLVPLDSTADVSNSPASKSVLITLERSAVQAPFES